MATEREIFTYWEYFFSFIHTPAVIPSKQIDNPKFLVPRHFEVRNVGQIVKDKLGVSMSETIILIAGNAVLKPNHVLKDVYDKYKDSDGFLYLKYIKEDSFG